MKRFLKGAGIACIGLCALAATSSAAIVVYEFSLSGSQEVPANASPAVGSATVTLNTETNFLTWDVLFSGLVGTYTNAHFHGPAAAGANAGPFIDVMHQPEFLGENSGNLTGTHTLDEAHKQIFLDGLAYINIHSTSFPGGELRGQVIPEPSTYAMLVGILALAGASFWRRRR